ncbi:MAG TPA: hypothetical protein VMI31_15735 [Fimbriimonadaceae bacterium]|nr:hypothetical protein [Fimbriimonadaceae bacterium]
MGRIKKGPDPKKITEIAKDFSKGKGPSVKKTAESEAMNFEKDAKTEKGSKGKKAGKKGTK